MIDALGRRIDDGVLLLDFRIDVARQVFVGLDGTVFLLIEEKMRVFEFFHQVTLACARQLFHIAKIDLALLLHGDDERILRRIGVLGLCCRLDGALREDVGRTLDGAVLSYDFEAPDERIACIVAEEHLELPVVSDIAELLCISVIEAAQLLLHLAQVFVRYALLLCVENPIAFIAHQNSEAHALFLLFGEILLLRLAAMVGEDDFAAFDRKAHALVVLRFRLHRRCERRIRGRIAASFAKCGKRFFDTSGKVFCVARNVKLLAELAASLLDFAENVVPVRGEIGVHRVLLLEGRGIGRKEPLDVLPAFGRGKSVFLL